MTAQPAAQPAAQTPRITRFVGAVSELAGTVAGIALVCAVLITAWGVTVRYVLKDPTLWQTEATIYMLILVAFLGAPYGAKHGAHVGVDVLPAALGVRGRLVLRILTTSAVLAVVVLLMVTGWRMWLQSYALDTHSSSAWGPPLWIPYAFMPLGMLLLALQYAGQIVEAGMALAGRLDPHTAALADVTGEAGHGAQATESAEATGGAQGTDSAQPTDSAPAPEREDTP